MTARQIDSKYTRFLVTFTSNGSSRTHEQFGPFKTVKTSAINSLTTILDQNHGRGEHTVTIHGLTYVDQTTPQQYKVGFSPNLVAAKDEELFSL